MTSSDEIIEIIAKCAPNFDTSKLKIDDNLKEQGLDSLDIMSTFFVIEEKYKIKVSDDDIEGDKLSSINKIVEYVAEKISN